MVAKRIGSLRFIVLSIVLLTHAVALWGLTRLETGRRMLAEMTPLFVNIIEPQPTPSAPKPPPEAPKPKRDPPRPPPRPVALPPPIIAAEAPPVEAAAEAPAPVAVAPEPEPAPPPKPVLLIPPSFNAAYLDNPAPTYPSASRRFGEEGQVVLRVYVNARGLADKVELSQSSGYDRLDRVALDTVRQWRFVPARRGDEAVSAWVLVPIAFRLGD